MKNIDTLIPRLGEDRPYKGAEKHLQIASANLLRFLIPKILFTHPPNGGKRDAKEAAIFKLQGVFPGVLDLLIFKALRGFHGLFIELKTKGNDLTDDQIKFAQQAIEEGYCVAACYNVDAVEDLVRWYFDIPRPISKNKYLDKYECTCSSIFEFNKCPRKCPHFGLFH